MEQPTYKRRHAGDPNPQPKATHAGLTKSPEIASLFFLFFTLKLFIAVLYNLVSTWCTEADNALTRGIEFPEPLPSRERFGASGDFEQPPSRWRRTANHMSCLFSDFPEYQQRMKATSRAREDGSL
eukprot:comp21473_c1_seq1/m.29725 comp21473_c1_seq1/g.29725  ORF comp21473_c1_seq1/g.29725 comp21473_c1_seq1/m.29725 type:complete len:126 (-) comp21473_c1_seq1:637-1014(-)